MAEKKDATGKKAEASTARAKPAKPAAPSKPTGQAPAAQNLLVYAAITAVAVIVIAVFYFIVAPSLNGVPFSVFKSDFNSAQRVALVTAYSNGTQFAFEYQCMTKVSGVISARPSVELDFIFINQQNASCLYSPIKLPALSNYHGINVSSKTASACLSIADSEPSIFLNYSNANSTRITPTQLHVYGNQEYMQRCPIAVDIG